MKLRPRLKGTSGHPQRRQKVATRLSSLLEQPVRTLRGGLVKRVGKGGVVVLSDGRALVDALRPRLLFLV